MKNKVFILLLLAVLLLVSCTNDREMAEAQLKTAFEENAVNIAGFSTIKNSVSNSSHYVYYFEDSCVKAYDKTEKASFSLCRDKNCTHENCVYGEKCVIVAFGGNVLFSVLQQGAVYEIYAAGEDGSGSVKIYETEADIRKPVCRNDVLYFYSQTENGAEIVSIDSTGKFSVCVSAENRPLEFCITDKGPCYTDRFGDLYLNDALIVSAETDYVQFFNGSIYYSNSGGIYRYDASKEESVIVCDGMLSDWVITAGGILYSAQTDGRMCIALYDPVAKSGRTVCDADADYEFWLFDGTNIYTMAETAEDKQKALDECRILVVRPDGSVTPVYEKQRSLLIIENAIGG